MHVLTLSRNAILHTVHLYGLDIRTVSADSDGQIQALIILFYSTGC